MARSSLKRKPLLSVAVQTTQQAEDAVGELLATILGTSPTTLSLVERSYSVVTAFIEAKQLDHALVAQIQFGLKTIQECGLDPGGPQLSVEKVRREDWAESWKRHFKPIRIGRKLLVKPSWIKSKKVPGQAVVIIDPGLSFGTGNHPTTSFCLSQIVDAAEQSKSFLDIGTGTGILAIAAAKLGYKTIEAFDFDPEAVRVAKTNVARNRVTDRIRIFRGDITKMPARATKRYDLVCANLIYDLLADQSAKVAARVRPGGRLVLAGILIEQFTAVAASFEKRGFKILTTREEKEWKSGTFQAY